ncbi:helix-turn-helix domain-containing protein [Nitrolancea hollandica]|uniref:HTH cro/C1-type domain-containing protein n=1 Tax=Nitrolancea hollandica Lb TaxID=1129897 RepID=I4ELB6_9BACT|nr:helix-turn-helix transcriptional regulator [Nitrolancea hollandica]CCF85478.1 hypothetical protein NITHO_500013 [Nitrolancea hollandica Lb]
MAKGWRRYHYDYQSFGCWTKIHRGNRTLKDIAEATGINRGSLSQVEAGKRPLPPEQRRKLIDELAATADEQAEGCRIAEILIPLPAQVGQQEFGRTRVTAATAFRPNRILQAADSLSLKELSPERASARLVSSLYLVYQGEADEASGRCEQLIHEIENSSWRKCPEALELLARSYITLAEAQIETLQPSFYNKVLAYLTKAEGYLEQLSRRTGSAQATRRLTSRLNLVRGMVARIWEDETRAGLSFPIEMLGESEQLLEAAKATDVVEDRIWARTELIKRLANRGDWHKVFGEFQAAQTELGAAIKQSSQSSVVSMILPVSLYEGLARVLIRGFGATQEAIDLLTEAFGYTGFRLNEFQISLTHIEWLLRSGNSIDGRGALEDLINTAPTSYQRRKALRLRRLL